MVSKADKAECLYMKYSRLLLKIAYRKTDDAYLAQDAVSQTFEKILKRLDTIDESDEKHTGALLILMCRQAVVDLHKQKSKVIGILLAEPPSNATAPDAVENEVVQSCSWGEIRSALSWLPRMYLDPFLMHHLDDMSISEVSQKLGITEGTVHTRLHRARVKLREEYFRNGGKLF